MITSIMPNSLLIQLKKMTIKGMMEHFEGNGILFSAIEIETINRCNGKCTFCPANSHMDTRPFAKMDEALFKKIINDVGELNYSGFLGLQSNNEPFMDKNIIERIAYARQRCPCA
jgi:MoaA/NifB/PqqE/SkfB family radical SAM enzyme